MSSTPLEAKKIISISSSMRAYGKMSSKSPEFFD